jgi:iron complex outermembrane receptor protein
MAYARYSRGYKAFGFSAGAYLPEPEADPETVNSYEVGVKMTLGGNVQINGALYYLDYRDLQAPVTVRQGAVNVGQFVNIAKSRSDGLELDVVWQPIQPLRLTFDYAYNDTKIKKALTLIDVNDFVANGASQSIVGNSLPQAPKHKLAVNGSYSFLMESGTLTLGATYAYRSKAYSSVFSREYNKAPSWDQVDLRAHWAPEGNKYTVIAYVKNVANTDGYDAGVGGNQRSNMNAVSNLELTPPRTYGIELQYRFF